MATLATQPAVLLTTGSSTTPYGSRLQSVVGRSRLRFASGDFGALEAAPDDRIMHVGRVIFMCGPASSGKSTVARRFEASG